ncbi:hypothetical protein V496_04774 [Pseudogymnoascus sp. VKM F-4515 (FW-2607)]|nr:hypothetical protein V496_04774 [Pseudogymnoascus sp. VKM F-4515 (FW-2607)]
MPAQDACSPGDQRKVCVRCFLPVNGGDIARTPPHLTSHFAGTVAGGVIPPRVMRDHRTPTSTDLSLELGGGEKVSSSQPAREGPD